MRLNFGCTYLGNPIIINNDLIVGIRSWCRSVLVVVFVLVVDVLNDSHGSLTSLRHRNVYGYFLNDDSGLFYFFLYYGSWRLNHHNGSGGRLRGHFRNWGCSQHSSLGLESLGEGSFLGILSKLGRGHSILVCIGISSILSCHGVVIGGNLKSGGSRYVFLNLFFFGIDSLRTQEAWDGYWHATTEHINR